MRDTFGTPNRLKFTCELSCYTLTIISLCMGAFFRSPIDSLGLVCPLLSFRALCLMFLMTWLFYLYFTLLITKRPPQHNLDRIMILGAGIFIEQVSPMLKARLDAALFIASQSNDNHVFIVSGEQGANKSISEALAMQRYLLISGVSKTHILMENQLTNTVENLAFSVLFFLTKKAFV